MKRVIGLIVLAMMVVLPMNVHAVESGISFAESKKGESKDGFYCEVTKKDERGNALEEKCYIVGRQVGTTPMSISQFAGQLELVNMTIKPGSITAMEGWTNASSGTYLQFTAAQPVSSAQFTIATFEVTVNTAGEYCAINLTPCRDGECQPKVEITETYTCRVVGGKYYGKNGTEVTEAVYNAECVTNPQTGSSMPYLVIVAGIVLAVGVFTISRKNTKLYKI